MSCVNNTSMMIVFDYILAQ